MNITLLCQVQQQEPLHHLQEVQQPVIMLCQQPAKELSSSKAHTLWGNPRNHKRGLRGILQGTLIMITLTPVETLGMMFHMVATASDPGAKPSLMEQVGALLKRCTFFNLNIMIMRFDITLSSHISRPKCLVISNEYPAFILKGQFVHFILCTTGAHLSNNAVSHFTKLELSITPLKILKTYISFIYRVIHELLTSL